MAMLKEPGYAGLGPRIPMRDLVPVPRLALAVFLRNARVFSKLWRGALLPTFLDPFLYLLALGFGLGTYIAQINGIPYKEFIAPGLIASAAMWSSAFETTYNVYFRMNELRLYDNVLATPVEAQDVVAGDLAWSSTRATVYGIVVLAVILLGITTATESAAVGAAGAFLLAFQARTLDWKRTKEAVFLTAKTTSMVCWLFVGSALFSAVFAILGGQALLESWVLSLNMTPVQFMILSQAIIFILGWPLEWTEIIVIFVPIFLPMLKHFNIDPILWGVLVFVNLQAAFLSPPVAMSAFYLKGVAPKHVTLNQIFAGMMPYMFIVIICMVLMYIWPGMTLWLPNYLYGN